MIANRQLIYKAMEQAKDAGSKKQQSKIVWFTRKIKYIIQESEKKTAKIQSHAEILHRRNKTCDPVARTSGSQKTLEGETHGLQHR